MLNENENENERRLGLGGLKDQQVRDLLFFMQ